MRNQQPPSPRVRGGDGSVLVHSIFYTIQGEGPYAGRPAVFVRLHGCNLQCPACDTDYTSALNCWSPQFLVDKIRHLYHAPGQRLVVFTGGEPLRQSLAVVIDKLLDHGCLVQIETNGTQPPPLVIHSDNLTIVCSPKTGRIHSKILPEIDAFKYVLKAGTVSPDDGLPTEALDLPARPILARPPDGFPREKIFVQPMDPDPDESNLRACIRSIYEFGYTLSLQQHKIIGVP